MEHQGKEVTNKISAMCGLVNINFFNGHFEFF
jgi:hypothetical protein